MPAQYGFCCLNDELQYSVNKSGLFDDAMQIVTYLNSSKNDVARSK